MNNQICPFCKKTLTVGYLKTNGEVTSHIAKKKNATSTASATAISSIGIRSQNILVTDEKVDVIVRVFMNSKDCEYITTSKESVTRVCCDYVEYVRMARRLQER